MIGSESASTSFEVIRVTNLRLSSASIVSSDGEITIIVLSRDNNLASGKKTVGRTSTNRGIDGNISLSSSEAEVSGFVQIVLTETAVESALVAVNTCNTAESAEGTVTTGTESVGTSVLVANIRLNATARSEVMSMTTESVVSGLTG